MDLKNEKGNFIIRPSALKKFITYADQKTLETLSLYQQNNPMDQRFSKIKLPQKTRNNSMKKRLSSLTSDKRSEQKPCLVAKHKKGKCIPDSSRKKE